MTAAVAMIVLVALPCAAQTGTTVDYYSKVSTVANFAALPTCSATENTDHERHVPVTSWPGPIEKYTCTDLEGTQSFAWTIVSTAIGTGDVVAGTPFAAGALLSSDGVTTIKSGGPLTHDDDLTIDGGAGTGGGLIVDPGAARTGLTAEFDTDALVVTNDKKVGIGTASPLAELDVIGRANFAPASLSAGGNILNMTVPAGHTTGVEVFRATGNTPGSMMMVVQNSGSGVTGFNIFQFGTGDPRGAFVGPTQAWAMGLDQSDNTFRIADSADLGVDDFFIADASLDTVTVPKDFIVIGGVSIPSGFLSGGIQTTTLPAAAITFIATTNFVILTGDGGANTLATITGAPSGTTLKILCVDALVTITDDDTHAADTVDLSSAFTCADDTVLNLLNDGTSWYEISRSVQSDAFGSIRVFALTTVTMTLPTQNVFKKIDVFEVDGRTDAVGRVTVDASNNEISITAGLGGAGEYAVGWHASSSVQGGAIREINIAAGFDPVATFSITGATTATPVVITAVGHGLLPGDMIIQSAVGGMSEADGSFITQDNTTDTYSIHSLSGVAVVGVGTYTSGGTIDIFLPAGLSQRRDTSQSSLGVSGAGGPGISGQLVENAKVALYAANLDGTQTIVFSSITLGVERIGN
jgi:hypothetical protein